MIKQGTCDQCGEYRMVQAIAHLYICAGCLRGYARQVERHQQRVAAAEADLTDATRHIFGSILTVADRTDDAPMTLKQIGRVAERVKSVVSLHVERLVEAGLVEKSAYAPRSIRLVREPVIMDLADKGGG